MIVAVAGRRIDAPGAQPPRFPLTRRSQTRRKITAALRRLDATVVVSSAACGADLLALDAARALGLRRRIILPYRPEWFLADSVTDRPGHWKALYESLIAEARATGDLVALDYPRGSDDAFRAVNENIVSEAQRLAQRESPSDPSAALGGLIIWEGAPRGPDDITQHLKERLEQAGGRVERVLTLPARSRRPEPQPAR
ncbi:MAG TPA: hypothetical protein VE338_08790 [Ktedonobacterales bacterium]|jgi:hypothetical protein|nr:hypothetical protein [Ktedonobacterales bacterium]